MAQPTLLPEVAYSDVEREFVDLSPPGLWPENQDSNIGQFRKVSSDMMQFLVDDISRIARETFIESSVDFLSLWEEMLGLPVSEADTATVRRLALAARRKRGAFTKARRRAVIQEHMAAVLGGAAAAFGPTGIPFGAGGFPLRSGVTADIETLYRVYDDPSSFSYQLWIVSTVTPDIPSLDKELERITPGGMDFLTIDNSRANILNYHRQILSEGPTVYYRLNGSGVDEGGLGRNGTVNGAPASIAAPGLLNAAVDDDLAGNADAAYDFDGVDDYISVAHSGEFSFTGGFTVGAVVRPDVADGAQRTIVRKGNSYLLDATSNLFRAGVFVGGVGQTISALAPFVSGTTYSVFMTYDYDQLRLYVNGVLQGALAVEAVIDENALALLIGAATATPTFLWNGGIDEVAVYGHVLSTDEILRLHKTAINTP